MFEVYKAEPTNRRGEGKWVSASTNGTLQFSAASVEHLNLSKDSRHEIYFDRETSRIGVKFVPAGSNGHSRAVVLVDSGSAQVNGKAFFRKFKLKTPAKGTRFTPSYEGELVVFEYPEILVAAE
jgi:hypothetical protein